MIVVGDEMCSAHLEGIDHPESPARLRAILDHLAARGLLNERRVARDATLDELALVHTRSYIDLVRREVEHLREEKIEAAYLSTGDVAVSAASYDVAVRAAGATLVGLDAVVGENRAAFAIVRPPGHHAEPARGMGFCVFNNAGIAARAFVEKTGSPALVVDFDYHHGNGTESLVGAKLSYCSTHASPAYPGTGAPYANRVAPEGSLIDLPLGLHYTTEGFVALWATTLRRLAQRIRPGLLVISAGYDFAIGDPVGNLGVDIAAASGLGAAIREIADAYCGGRALFVLEGGYNLDVLARGVSSTIEAYDSATSALGVPDEQAVNPRENALLDAALSRAA